MNTILSAFLWKQQRSQMLEFEIKCGFSNKGHGCLSLKLGVVSVTRESWQCGVLVAKLASTTVCQQASWGSNKDM